MRSRIIVSTALIALLIPLLVVGFWTTRVDAQFSDEIKALAAWLSEQGLAFVNYSFVDFVANMLWFVPFAAIALVLVGSARWPLVLLGCVAVSVVIELGQAYLLPARVGTPTDVVANSLGAIAGILLGVAVDQVLSRRRRRVQTA